MDSWIGSTPTLCKAESQWCSQLPVECLLESHDRPHKPLFLPGTYSINKETDPQNATFLPATYSIDKALLQGTVRGIGVKSTSLLSFWSAPHSRYFFVFLTPLSEGGKCVCLPTCPVLVPSFAWNPHAKKNDFRLLCVEPHAKNSFGTHDDRCSHLPPAIICSNTSAPDEA